MTVNLYSDQTQSALDNVRASLLLAYAEVGYLSVIGNGFGIPRAPEVFDNDDLYRSVIELLAWLPRNRMLMPHLLAEILFGSQASIVAAGKPAWQVYVVNANELIFECPEHLLATSNDNASYLHGWHGQAVRTAADTITVTGTDASLAVSTSLVGMFLYIQHGGVWNQYSILTHAYNAGTSTNTFTLNPAAVPAGDYPMFVDVPSSDSFTGDYMPDDATEHAGQVSPPTAPVSMRTYLAGQGLLDVFIFYMQYILAAGVVLRTVVI